MKVYLDYDEWFPFFAMETPGSFGARGARECEVPEETVVRWKLAMDSFFDVQHEMRDTFGFRS